MKTAALHTRLALPLLSLLAAIPARAITYTWDGGGADNNLSTAANWNPDGAPVSDLVNTDLIFGGAVRLTPNLSAGINTDSVVFNNTSGAFTLGGQTLTIGTTGITNSDVQLQTFTNAVSLGTVSSTFNASAGPLAFTGTVTVPGATGLTLAGGGAQSLNTVAGTGTVTKSGAGTVTWSQGATAAGADFAFNTGTVNTGADATTDVLDPTASISVNNSAIFNIGENLTLNGAQLARGLNASLSLAAGKTLLVQNGGDVTITGAHNFNSASTLNVTGAAPP